MGTHDAVAGRDRQRLVGISALALFFAVAAAASAACAFSLLSPGTAVDALWTMNQRATFGEMAIGGAVLLSCMATASLLAAVGLWKGIAWGRTLAIVVLVESGLAATAYVVVSGDPRGIVAQPIVALLSGYLLLSPRVQRFFRGAGSERIDPIRGDRERLIRDLG